MSSDRYIVRQPRVDLNQLTRGHLAMPGVLKRLGYTAFREGQDKIVSCIMAGQDTLGILPTSTGKTLAFVAPTLALGWRTLVFSPLISLMHDQQQSLSRKGVRVGNITSHNPQMNVEFMRQWRAGDLEILYVAPERLKNEEFLQSMRAMPPDMVAVDECFTPDVEILTEDGWARFDQLQKGRKVAQVDPADRGITFTVPTDYIQKPHSGRMIRVKSHRLCDLTMTPEHELLVQWPSGWRKQAADKVRFNSTKYMAAAGFGRGDGPAQLTPRERLLIAYQADGNLHRDRVSAGLSTLAFSFTRERKIIRFLQLMDDGGFDWAEVADRDGRRRFLVKNVPTATKLLSDHFRLENMSQERAAAFIAEAVEWDGSKISDSTHYYSCTVPANTDFMQAVCVLAGYKSNKVVQEDVREPQYKDVHRLFITLNASTFNTQQLEKIDEVYEGDVFCVRVPKGCIVVRRNGKPVVVGNCHCLSSWSDTFRHAYCVIGDFITEFQPQVVTALTATCPPRVEQDIRRVLCMEKAIKVMHYPRRTNLDLRSLPGEGTLPIVPFLERRPGPSLVYCVSKKATEQTASELSKYLGREIGFYHGGLKKSLRSHTQDRFMHGDLDIVCATNAFGMGIDKSNIRLLIHRDIAGSAEATAQEVGRAGRDGNYSLCQTLFSNSSIHTHRFLINMSSPAFDDVEKVYKALQKLSDRSGLVTAGDDAIAKAAYMNGSWSLPAIYQILSGAQVINKVKDKDKICSVRLRNRIDDPKLMALLDILQIRGDPGDDGYTDISMPLLADELDVSAATVSKRLNDWAKAGVVEYVPPDRSRPVQLLGDIKQVDAERVDSLRQISFAKLEQTIVYGRDIPDSEKHAYLETCLGVTPPHHAG